MASNNSEPTESQPTPRFIHSGLAHQIIAVGFNTLARLLHPDGGGTEESLIALNKARRWLDRHLQ